MRFSSVVLISLFVLGFISCGSKQNRVQEFAYEEAYKAKVETYLDSVNPQLYYHTDQKQVLVPEGTVFHIKKSDTN